MPEKKTKKTPAKSTISAEKLYLLVSRHSGKAVEASQEEAVTLQKAARRTAQYWRVEPAGDATVKLISAATGKALDIVWNGTENGAQIHQWEYVGGENQQWILESVGGDAYKLKSLASGKCLDVVDMSCEDGALLQIWEDVNGENQQWILKEVKLPAPKAKTTKKTSPKK